MDESYLLCWNFPSNNSSSTFSSVIQNISTSVCGTICSTDSHGPKRRNPNLVTLLIYMWFLVTYLNNFCLDSRSLDDKSYWTWWDFSSSITSSSKFTHIIQYISISTRYGAQNPLQTVMAPRWWIPVTLAFPLTHKCFVLFLVAYLNNYWMDSPPNLRLKDTP